MTLARMALSLTERGKGIWWIFGVHWPWPGPDTFGYPYPVGYEPDLMLTADGFALLRLKPIDEGRGGFKVMPYAHPRDIRQDPMLAYRVVGTDGIGTRLGVALGRGVEVGSVISWRRLRDAVTKFAAGETWAAHVARGTMKP